MRLNVSENIGGHGLFVFYLFLIVILFSFFCAAPEDMKSVEGNIVLILWLKCTVLKCTLSAVIIIIIYSII